MIRTPPPPSRALLPLFNVPTGQNAQRERLRRYLRDKGFGYLQDSVWISPDPLAQEREILGGGKINVESLILLEARPCAFPRPSDGRGWPKAG